MYDVPMYYVLFIFCFKDNVITMTIWDKRSVGDTFIYYIGDKNCHKSDENRF